MPFFKTFISLFATLCLASINSETQIDKVNRSQLEKIAKGNNNPFQNKFKDSPLQVAIIGLTHDHAHWILGRGPSRTCRN